MFPFKHFSNDNHFYSAVAENMLNCKLGYNEHKKIFQPSDINHDVETTLNEIDTDFQFHSDIRHLFNTKCDYNIEDMFREKITQEYKDKNRFSFFYT